MSRSMFRPLAFITIESNFAVCDERNHSSLLPSLEFFSNGIKLSRKAKFFYER